ncbi:MAG: hypothetical protein R6U32_03815 [Candidatus Woesearchaeota archaeon]
MAKEESQNELETLKSDVAQLRTDLGELMDSFRQKGQEQVDETKSWATSEVDHLRKQLKQAYGKARQEGQDVYETAHHSLETHPLTSIGLAFGLGLLIGKIISK